MRKVFWTFLFLLAGVILFAQQKTHKVKAQETIYGISKQYGISQDDLVEANPFLKERVLQIGDELIIPNQEEVSDGTIVFDRESIPPRAESTDPKEDESYIYITVKSGETISSLTREYGISEDALKSLNPQLQQGLKENDIIRIPKNAGDSVPDGMYKVKKGETVYKLSRQFGVSEDEFYISNPIVQIDGLKEGSYIKIPQKGKINAVIYDNYIETTIKQGDNIYTISKTYGVSFADLMNLNPELANGLKAGMKLKIPLNPDADIIKIGSIKRVNDNEISLALILPFHLDSEKGHDQEKRISTDILIGSKIALDSLGRKGKRINLKVFDSQNDTKTLEKLLAENDFSQFDAVIGPLFASNFSALAGILEESGIVMVTPMSNTSELKGFNNVLIPTPSDESIADAIALELTEDYKGQQIQILTDDKYEGLTGYFVGEIRKKLPKADIIITKNVKDLIQKSETLTETLNDGETVEKEYFTPIITVLVSDSNSLGDAYIKRLLEMNPENLTGYGVKFVAAYDIYNTNNKKNISELRNIGFTYATFRLIDVYGAKERSTLNKFIDLYCDTPNEYQQIGFDIVYDLVDRMNKSGDVVSSLTNENKQLSSKYRYEKEGKAFVNKAVRVIRIKVKQDESPDDGIQVLND